MMQVMRAVLLCLMVLGFASQAKAQPRQWTDPDLGRGIAEGVATQDHIWLRGSLGKVVRFDRATSERQVVAENVRDMMAADGRLWVLAPEAQGGSFVLTDLRSSQPVPSPRDQERRIYLHASRDSEGEVIGLFAWPGADRPAILATRAVAVPEPGGWRRRDLPADLYTGGWIAAPSPEQIYVGYNRGEWGGGLRRIDLPSATISFVSEPSEALCGGVLNPACDPVVGVHADSASSGCVIVGSGIAHLSSSRSEVFRVCGSDISSVFSTPVPEVKDQWMMTTQPWPLHGLFETSEGWVGISRERYFLSRDGQVTEHPMPIFRDWSGIRISEEENGVLFIVSACCLGTSAGELYSTLAVPVSR